MISVVFGKIFKNPIKVWISRSRPCCTHTCRPRTNLITSLTLLLVPIHPPTSEQPPIASEKFCATAGRTLLLLLHASAPSNIISAIMFRAAAAIALASAAAPSAAGQNVFFSEIRFDHFGTGQQGSFNIFQDRSANALDDAARLRRRSFALRVSWNVFKKCKKSLLRLGD